MPNLRSLSEKFPQITLELVPQSTNADLSKREADLAVRFARPTEGGLRTKSQKLGTLKFKVYVPRSVPQEASTSLGWITYGDTYSTFRRQDGLIQ